MSQEVIDVRQAALKRQRLSVIEGQYPLKQVKEVTANRDLAGDDDNFVLVSFSDSNITLGIPSGLAFAFDVVALSEGAGDLILDGASGVTVNGVSGASVTLSQQYGSMSLSQVAANNWTITEVEGSGASTPALEVFPGDIDIVNTTPGSSQMGLSWSASSGATSYRVEYRQDRARGWRLFDGAVGATTTTVTGLEGETPYWFRVFGINSQGRGNPSLAVLDTTSSTQTVPGTVTNLSAVPGNTLVTLSWRTPDIGFSPITDYLIEFQEDGAGSWTIFAHNASPNTKVDVTGLTNGTTYNFRVSAVNAIGTATASNVATAAPVQGQATVPAAITGLLGTAGDTTLILGWSAPSSGGSAITDYIVQYRVQGSGTWLTFSDGVSATPGATITGLTNSTTYEARVFAVNGVGTSAASNVVAATPGASPISMTQLTANRVYQRTVDTGGESSKGYGPIEVDVTLGQTATTMQYRVRQVSGGSTLKDWTAATGTFTAGAQTITCPQVPAHLGALYIDLRMDNDNGTAVLGTSAIHMGRVIFVSGQSLAVRFFGKMDSQGTTGIADAGITINPNGYVYGRYEDSQRSVTSPSWQLPADGGADYDSTFAAQFLDLQVDDAGVSCALVGYTDGGRRIDHFTPGGAGSIRLRSMLDDVGGFESFIWYQGHTNAAIGTTYTDYKADLDDLYADIVARNSRSTNFTMLVGTIPNITSTSWGTATQINDIRRAASDWVQVDNSYGVYVQPPDIALIDGVHQSQTGSVAFARHFHRASYPDIGVTGDHLGPTVASASRSGTDITVSFTHRNGATAFNEVGNFENRIEVFASGSTTLPLALDGTTPLTVNADNIVVKLASDPGSATPLDIWFQRSPDSNDTPSHVLYDNASGDNAAFSVGRNVRTNLAAIAVSAGSIGQDLTMTSATYGTGETGFGQRLTGGSGITASAMLPATTVWSIETRFSRDTAGSLEVMMGEANKAYIGINSSGRIIGAFRTAAGDRFVGSSTNATAGTNTVVTDGSNHHVALVSDGSEVRLYLDGVLEATNTTDTPVSTVGATGMGIKRFGAGSPFEFGTAGGVATVDEPALWNIAKYTSGFTTPTSPYTGAESGLIGLWHLDGDGLSA